MFDWIVGMVERTGYVGVAALMFAENLFPPIPSELIMPLAGFTAAKGELNIVLVAMAGTAGALLGAVFWYYIGRWVGCERLKRWAARHGRWLTLEPEEVDTAAEWFRRRCGMAVFIGRLVPAVRTLISIPAGVAGMALVPFLVYSTLGTAIWSAILAGAGYRDCSPGWLSGCRQLGVARIGGGWRCRCCVARPDMSQRRDDGSAALSPQ